MLIHQLLPGPVHVELGGLEVRCGELKLKDVAKIQQWIAAVEPCPYSFADRIRLHSLEGRERQVEAARIFEKTEFWPSQFGSPAANKLMRDPGGIRMLITCCVKPYTEITSEEIDTILNNITEDEYFRLCAVAYGLDPLDELAREIDAITPEVSTEPVNWSKLIWDIIEQTHWDFETVGNLTLTQFKCIRSHGKSQRGEGSTAPGESAESVAMRRREVWKVLTESREATNG